MYTREYALIKYMRLLSRNFSLKLIKSTKLPIKIIGFAETKIDLSCVPLRNSSCKKEGCESERFESPLNLSIGCLNHYQPKASASTTVYKTRRAPWRFILLTKTLFQC